MPMRVCVPMCGGQSKTSVVFFNCFSCHFWDRLSMSPELTNSAKLISTRDPPVSAFQHWGYIHTRSTFWCGCWGCKLRSSYSCIKHFTDWVFTSVPAKDWVLKKTAVLFFFFLKFLWCFLPSFGRFCRKLSSGCQRGQSMGCECRAWGFVLTLSSYGYPSGNRDVR